MEYSLTRQPDEILVRFGLLRTRQDVADLLEVDDKFLRVVLYGTKERMLYRMFEIQKKSHGTRVISVPPKNLAILQRKLNTVLNLVYEPKWCAFGFVRGKNIVGNAAHHCAKRHVLNIDLEDFFPTINVHRVRGAISSYGVGKDAALVIAQICCMADGSLPQGGPTSPIISNIICRSMDNELMLFAKELRCRYTRYADDLTFSTNLPRLPAKLARPGEGVQLGSTVVSVIERHGFKINSSKTRCFSPAGRQEVTGLTVNEFANVKRGFVRRVSHALHIWEAYGYEKANNIYTEKLRRQGQGAQLRTHLRGNLCFLRMVLGQDAPIYRKGVKRFNLLSPTNPLPLRPLTKADPYPLRGKPPSESWSLWFRRYESTICFLEARTDKGDKCAATAFRIGRDTVVTARHNVECPDFYLFIGDQSIPKRRCHVSGSGGPDVALIRIVEPKGDLVYLPTQMRLPEIGEEVCAVGYPTLPQRDVAIVMHVGMVEALPTTYDGSLRFIQVSFQSGGGLSGAPLIDRRGFVVGVMVENIFSEVLDGTPCRPYGQAVPIEYLCDILMNSGDGLPSAVTD